MRAGLIDVGLVAVSASYSALTVYADTQAESKWIVTMIAAAGLLLRRRWPYASLLLTLPGFAWGFAVFAMMIALYSVAYKEPRLGRVVVAAVVSCLATPSWSFVIMNLRPDLAAVQSLWTAVLFATLYSAAPAALGVAVRTTEVLRAEVLRVRILQDQRTRSAAEKMLERERAVLAREMHDVVSNQVSLIAVQAGALQVSGPDEQTRVFAGTIRRLSVTTLDELRAMIEVLRAAGGTDRSPAPQPTLEDLSALIDECGIAVDAQIGIEQIVPIAHQRAAYRLVQEGLTNARKHAPGAGVSLRITASRDELCVELLTGSATAPPLDLPSAHHGLIGLRERAELLGGALEAALRDNGTHLLILRIPLPAPERPARRS
ncbi:histidine kinase [Rathayibacter festucae]|uniref:sensor histidine kinase n=1 Tax=Rathayibacter festucae TaxID=110937 RepID=UPI001FB397B2|nr:histidine kinase [Rathayibacter festucae]MCJ1701793.1 histidine kinase [Rathayibacter festucae]